MVELPHCSAETLSALLDGELAGEERALARAHLAACRACQERAHLAERLDAELQDAGQLSCASIRPTLSALADDEATAGERLTANAHLEGCASCRALRDGLGAVDRAIAALPPAAPSAWVDAAIADRTRRPAGRNARLGPARLGLRAAAALSLALLVAALATLGPGAAPAGQAARPDLTLVASVQQVVFDARTNTLYVLDSASAQVSAVDATTQAERARVLVGGTPTALALSPALDRVLVLDAKTKRLTEIDTLTNTVVGAATLEVTGTPTSLQVDPAGKIVVASIAAVTPANATSAPGTPSGHVTVFDAVSKQVETVRVVDVAPQLVVLDPTGAQALLLSASATTLVDGATYRSLDRLPGGVAAAFDATGSQVAILGADAQTGSRITFRGPGLPAALTLSGRPLALIALPGGGFAALLDRGAAGAIDVIDAAGRLTASLSVALAGHSLTFDPASGRFAVGGDVGTVAFSGATTVAVSGPAAQGAAPQAVAPATTPAASPSAAPAASAPAPAPSAAPATPNIPPAAQLGGSGAYRLALTDNRRPVLLAGSGRTLWSVDETKRLATVDTQTGAVTDRAQLPLDGDYSRLLVGTDRVYAVDRTGRIVAYAPSSGAFSVVGFPFAATASGFAVGPDDRLWLAGGESSNVLALDPFSKRVAAFDLRTSGISALHVDTAGRVWFADDRTGGLGYFDQLKQAVVTVAVPPHASVTALAMDRDGTLWAGSVDGGLLSVRLGVGRPAGSAGGTVSALVRDAAGGVWAYVRVPGAVAYRALTTGGLPQLAATSGAALAFDQAGRAWIADPAAGGFYIVGNGAR